MQPGDRIEGDTVRLRPIEPAEAAAILAGRLPAGLEFADGYPSVFSREVMDIFVGERRAEAPTFTPFFILRRPDGAVIGEIGWSNPYGPAAPVVGYDIVEPLWGHGYATDALRALTGYLFGLPHVDRVCADTTKDHAASRRVMEKAGMTFVREGVEKVDGELQELVYYEITRAEHQAAAARRRPE